MCAQYLDDLRVNKIILEAGQMLSTAARLHGPKEFESPLYRKAHPGHPCTKWVQTTRSNYEWCISYWVALNIEKKRRTNRAHSAWERFRKGEVFRRFASCIPDGPLTPFANATRRVDLNIDFRHVVPTTLAYRKYLDARWTIEAENDRPKFATTPWLADGYGNRTPLHRSVALGL